MTERKRMDPVTRQININSLRGPADEARIRMADDRLQGMWQLIAERTLAGFPVSFAQIRSDLLLSQTTLRRRIGILLDAGEITNVGTERRPAYNWTGLVKLTL